MQRLADGIQEYQLNNLPTSLPSLMGEAEAYLSLLEQRGESHVAKGLREVLKEMDYRETTARENARDDRRRANSMADRILFLEEVQRNLAERLESALLDKDETIFQLNLKLDNARGAIQKALDEIQGAFDDGQAMAINVMCLKLGGILNLDAEILEAMLVQAQNGNLEAAEGFMNQLLDSIQQAA